MSTMDEVSIQWRRAKWFDYVCRRFDLVSFRDLAEWIAREPGSATCNNKDRFEQEAYPVDSGEHYL
jgi:hypothetical protein